MQLDLPDGILASEPVCLLPCFTQFGEAVRCQQSFSGMPAILLDTLQQNGGCADNLHHACLLAFQACMQFASSLHDYLPVLTLRMKRLQQDGGRAGSLHMQFDPDQQHLPLIDQSAPRHQHVHVRPWRLARRAGSDTRDRPSCTPSWLPLEMLSPTLVYSAVFWTYQLLDCCSPAQACR